MKLKALKLFFDRVEDLYVKKGETIEREDKRAKELLNAGVVQEVTAKSKTK